MATVMAFGVVAGVAGGSASAQVSTKYDASIDATIADIQNFWSQAMPDVYGQQYEAIPADRIYPYSQDNPPPNCDDGGQTKAPYDQVAGNAFYCSNGDFVAYDEQGLLPKLRDNFGEFAVGLVFAHELGHAVQARVGYQPSATVYMEQQADCFAGAWAQHVADSEDANVHLSSSDLDTALAGLLTLSDPSGIDGSQDGAHGNGFDRVGAFQDGYEGGAKTCAAYQQHPPAITETGYSSYQDQASGGNLPLDQLVPTVTTSLADYWSSQSSKLTAPSITAGDVTTGSDSDGGVLTDSVTYQPSTNSVHYDAATLQDVHDTIGDFGSGMLIATAWASSVEHQLGTSVDSDAARRGAECLAGAWAASTSSSLSPGDLDEAVTVLVAAGKGSTDRGTAFDRVAAFRTGFKDGPSKCVQSS
ncbi:MAG TPA: neutral zinc metallopeptidase [Acidimicrobiia bacterium]|jgi:predicted metalloprotease|nr:neutral zinc metallopeptidase [Acidimicrobiia bacterium]